VGILAALSEVRLVQTNMNDQPGEVEKKVRRDRASRPFLRGVVLFEAIPTGKKQLCDPIRDTCPDRQRRKQKSKAC